MWRYLLFIMVAFGAKVILAAMMIYLLFATDRECPSCDGETVAIQFGPVGRLVAWVYLGRLHRRWCPRCGWEGFARGHRPDLRRLRPHVTEPESPVRDPR